jgi:hypothetical protein
MLAQPWRKILQRMPGIGSPVTAGNKLLLLLLLLLLGHMRACVASQRFGNGFVTVRIFFAAKYRQE